ncbi:MAG: PQQ-dependent sugar dehydrogenase, partial [Acidimicrobiales bacterium]
MRAGLAVLVLAATLGACGDGGPAGEVGAGGIRETTTAPGETTTAPAAPDTTAPPAPATTPPPTAAPPPTGSCSLGAQSPPSGTIPANNATALAFAPDGRLFWAERSGTVRVWQDGAAKEFARVSVSTSGERGLLGLAYRDRFVYAFYSDANGSAQHVVRWTDCAGTGQNEEIIIDLPAGSSCCHKGGRIAFGPEGALYVTLGDLFTGAPAQDTSDVRGKVLRYNAGGSVPADNPFGSGNPVWAYGFRNPFGIAFGPGGQLSVTNNGPTGDAGSPSTGYDTAVVAVRKGGNYQWPNCYGY